MEALGIGKCVKLKRKIVWAIWAIRNTFWSDVVYCLLVYLFRHFCVEMKTSKVKGATAHGAFVFCWASARISSSFPFHHGHPSHQYQCSNIGQWNPANTFHSLNKRKETFNSHYRTYRVPYGFLSLYICCSFTFLTIATYCVSRRYSYNGLSNLLISFRFFFSLFRFPSENLLLWHKATAECLYTCCSARLKSRLKWRSADWNASSYNVWYYNYIQYI